MEQEEKLCDKMKTVREFTYPGNRVSAGGGYEAAVTAKQDVGGLSLANALSCCMVRNSSQAEKCCI